MRTWLDSIPLIVDPTLRCPKCHGTRVIKIKGRTTLLYCETCGNVPTDVPPDFAQALIDFKCPAGCGSEIDWRRGFDGGGIIIQCSALCSMNFATLTARESQTNDRYQCYAILWRRWCGEEPNATT